MLRCLQTLILVTIVAEYVHAYEIYKEHQGPQPCGGRLKGPVGTITTPNFPNPFPVPIKCKWIIEHDIVNGTISIYFTQQYTTSGLTFTEYMYYDESYKLGERRALTLTDENIARIKWLQVYINMYRARIVAQNGRPLNSRYRVGHVRIAHRLRMPPVPAPRYRAPATHESVESRARF
ncbi:hypothetical protein HF086_012715 [Spodoptera exigua]|uniref:CUB domain-containing protein n=1 Tax=Spodoptera exigua TaxID=7107 RepID=A0A922MRB6_SPOEX|nr:hypothetical protein HF086_012715 [Spodoptera exigua]